MGKLRIAVVFGGRSAEHEVSIQSAASIVAALDRSKYDILPVKIRKDGGWEVPSLNEHAFVEGLVGREPQAVALLPEPSDSRLLVTKPPRAEWRTGGEEKRLDVVFPVVHGTYGEDGRLQGLLELAGIPYVGAGVAASSVGMDKALMKSLFRERELPVVPDQVLLRFDWTRDRRGSLDAIEHGLGYPLFVKPACLGSSVGVNKVRGRAALEEALDEAFVYDRKAIVELAVDAREIEVSVMGNDEPVASLPGEIRPSREFYDYRAKYLDDRSELLIPAPLDTEQVKEVQRIALQAYGAIDACGMARADMFMDRSSNKIYVNELNTIPGFTHISMYTKLWEASGLDMPELLDRLIRLAIEKATERDRLRTDFEPGHPISG